MDSRCDIAVLEFSGDHIFAGYFHPNTTVVVRIVPPTPGHVILSFIVLPRAVTQHAPVLEHIDMHLVGTTLFAGVFRPGKCVVVHIDMPNPGPLVVSFWILDEGIVLPLSNRTSRSREIQARPLERPEGIDPLTSNKFASGSSSGSLKHRRPSDDA